MNQVLIDTNILSYYLFGNYPNVVQKFNLYVQKYEFVHIGRPIIGESCENIFVSINDKTLMLQAVSIYTKADAWKAEEMLPTMLDIAKTSLKVMKIIQTS